MKTLPFLALALPLLVSPSARAQIPDLLRGYYANPAGTTFETAASAADKLNAPQDLDFDPRTGNLWIVNKDTPATGGSTVKITNPGKAGRKAQWQRDQNAWHFMLMPTSIAFGDNGHFATTPDALDANHGGHLPESFTGPSLWNADPAIYAVPNDGNGSHVDMLHESPYSLGIAHEKGNAYWVFDANSKDIVRYDFQEPHEPGGDDHSDAIIHRYPEVPVSRINKDLTCHLVVHKAEGRVYVVDGGSKRVLRLDIASGKVGGRPAWPMREEVEEYLNVTGVKWQVIIDQGLKQPVGIDVLGNTLVVSDHADGSIVFFDLSALPPGPEGRARELGRIATGARGIQGLVIGPDGRIWFVDTPANQVKVATPSPLTSILSPAVARRPGLRPGAGPRFLHARDRTTQPLVLDARGRIVPNLALPNQE